MKAIGKEITLNFIRSKLSENIDQLFKRECESVMIILIKSKYLLPFWYEPLDKNINSNHACNINFITVAKASREENRLQNT